MGALTPDAAVQLNVPRGNVIAVDPRSRDLGTVGDPAHRRLTYRPELDGIRGIAILLVLVVHLYLPETDAFGWVGVELFFVLSGYLITGILVAEYESTGTIGLRSFYARRVRRLAPALLVLIVIVTMTALLIGHREAIVDAAWALFYVANWQVAGGQLIGGLSHTWSLAIEEQFYLAWPLLLVVALRRGGSRAALGVAVTMGVASLVWRVALFVFNGDLSRAYYGSDVRLDALMAGCALALVKPRWAPSRLAIIAAVAVIFLVALTPVAGHELMMLGPGLGGVILAGLVLVSVRGGPFTFGPLVAIGKLSYSLYLWHYPIMYGAHLLWGVAPPWTIPAAFAAAWLSYRYVERPFRSVRRQLPIPPRAAWPLGDAVVDDHRAVEGIPASAQG